MPTNYTFDPTGASSANRVTGEQHVVNAIDFRDFNFLIPDFAPFFTDTFVVSFRDGSNNIRTMAEGVDYIFSHQFISASKATAKPVFGSITFLNNQISGVVSLTYNTIGGNWTLSETKIAEILASALYNPRVTSWEQVVDMPVSFPVIDHEWNLVDMVGASEVVNAIEGIRDALLINSQTNAAAHIADTNNPHQTTKEQVGLGNVQNYPIATGTEALAGTSNNTYVTPALVKLMLDGSGGNDSLVHANNLNNPHQTTKAQVGLNLVDNYATATIIESTTGTATNRFMTPAGVKAVRDLITTAINQHIADTNNPHSTTKNQIGLINLLDYPIATQAEAEAGASDQRYMSPLKTKQAITLQALTPLNNHISDSNNPHGVNKTQIGLGNVPNYAAATLVEARNSTINDKLITPASLAYALDGYRFGFPGQVVTTMVSTLPASASNYRLVRVDNSIIDLEGAHIDLAYMACPSGINNDPVQTDFLYRYTNTANPNGSRSASGRYLKMPPPGYFMRPYDVTLSGGQYKLQQDSFQQHTHISTSVEQVPGTGQYGPASGFYEFGGAPQQGVVTRETTLSGGSENRPKSFPVYIWLWY